MSGGFEVDPDDLEQLVTKIKATGIRSVSAEAGELNLPGVWVVANGYTFDKLDGYTLNAQLLLVVPDTKPKQARKQLVKLLNQVLSTLKPTGPVTGRGVNLPGQPGGVLPALAFPLDVHCDPAPQEE